MSTRQEINSRSVGDIAEAIAIGIRCQKRFSHGMTDEEKIELEREITAWGAQQFYLEKSRSFDSPYFKRN